MTFGRPAPSPWVYYYLPTLVAGRYILHIFSPPNLDSYKDFSERLQKVGFSPAKLICLVWFCTSLRKEDGIGPEPTKLWSQNPLPSINISKASSTTQDMTSALSGWTISCCNLPAVPQVGIKCSVLQVWDVHTTSSSNTPNFRKYRGCSTA